MSGSIVKGTRYRRAGCAASDTSDAILAVTRPAIYNVMLMKRHPVSLMKKT